MVKNKKRRKEILKEMLSVKGGEFNKWYSNLSDEDKKIYRDCLESLR